MDPFHPPHSSAVHLDDDWPSAEAVDGPDSVRRDCHEVRPEIGIHPDDWSICRLNGLHEMRQAPRGDQNLDTVTPSPAHLDTVTATDLDALWIEHWTPPETLVNPLPEYPVEVPEPLHARPPSVAPVFDPAERWALSRASLLVDGLDIAERKERGRALMRLAAVIERFPFGASVQAIRRSIELGSTIDEIEAMAEVKEAWSDDSSLWLIRRHDRVLRRTVPIISQAAAQAMTWQLASRLLRLGPPDKVIDEITGEIRDSWLELRPKNFLWRDDLRSSFYSYTKPTK